MEVIGSAETSVTTYMTPRRHDAYPNPSLHRHENRKYHVLEKVKSGEISGSHDDEERISVFWDVALCILADNDRRFIALMMESVRTSETSVNF
jgi:hypothetical protein